MNNRLFFDVTSRGYDFLTGQAVWRAQVRRVLDFVETSSTILDLGCGPGESAFELATARSESSVVGVDISPRMIDRARGHHARRHPTVGNVRFEVGDATHLPFGDGAFDLIVGHSFLYLVPDPHAVLAEARRVLAPGGLLVLMEPRLDGDLLDAARLGFGHDLSTASATDAARFVASMAFWRFVSGNVGRLDPVEVERWLRAAGFGEARTQPTLGGLGMHCIAGIG